MALFMSCLVQHAGWSLTVQQVCVELQVKTLLGSSVPRDSTTETINGYCYHSVNIFTLGLVQNDLIKWLLKLGFCFLWELFFFQNF